MKDLKEKTIRGGLARIIAQVANFALRLGSLMMLARLLGPADFGLVGMVTALTGVLDLFRGFGLSVAAVQKESITEEQMSTLFWINILVGGLLTLLLVAAAPGVAAFYHQPRLIAVTHVLSLGFIFNAIGIQHGARLQRQLHFTAMAVINTVAWIAAIAVGVGGAAAGYGYWSLVAMTLTQTLTTTVGYCVAARWVPGRPHRRVGIGSLMRFGGAVTVNGLVVYIATNFEKILLGRYWGADAIGIYGRAYQLSNIPISNLNSSAGEVAFPALSRVQDDLPRLRNYFLKGYGLVLALTVPATVGSALFSSDLIHVLMGSKWNAATPVFRLLAPTILVSAISNPLSWLLMSLGKIRRLFIMSLVISPVMMIGYLIGLPYGPNGVASAYSIVMMLWVLPMIAWAVHGTAVSFRDVLVTACKPLVCGVVAGVIAFGVRLACGDMLSPLSRLVLECGVLLVLFFSFLLFIAGQKSLYLDIVRGLKGNSALREQDSVSN